MNRDSSLRDWLLCIFAAGAALAVMVCLLTRCTPANSPTAPDVFQFTDDQIMCVEQADSRPAANECRASALFAFCRRFPNATVCPDAGAGQ